MRYFKLFNIFIFCIASQLARAEDTHYQGICILDRTVDSYDFKTWITAKSRAMPDYIPIKFNDRLLYLGPQDADRIIFTNSSNPYLPKQKATTYVSRLVNSSISLIYLDGRREGEERPFVIYSRGIAPYFFGECQVEK
jgi:hypothetical protein